MHQIATWCSKNSLLPLSSGKIWLQQQLQMLSLLYHVLKYWHPFSLIYTKNTTEKSAWETVVTKELSYDPLTIPFGPWQTLRDLFGPKAIVRFYCSNWGSSAEPLNNWLNIFLLQCNFHFIKGHLKILNCLMSSTESITQL